MSAAAALDRAAGLPRPGGLRSAFYASRLYPLTLLGRAPRGLALHAPDPWPGDAALGDRLFQGRYRFAGREAVSPGGPVWAPPGIDPAWTAGMHGFGWLRHFKASGGETARRHARAVVADWIRNCGRWRPGAWDAAVLGRRIAAWSACAGFLLRDSDPRWRAAFLASLDVQARHLRRAALAETSGADRFAALRGLLHAGLCLDRGERGVARAARLLARECAEQVRPDGGHRDRSPARHCAALADLVDCRDLLLAAGRTPPEPIPDTIDRMARALAALRHGDGGLAAFNDSAEDTDPPAADVLKAAGGGARAPAGAERMGFQRLAAGRTAVIVDAAPAAGRPSDHAGAAAFEMSAGAARLVVNCGPHSARSAEWADALRSTAAHSTLVVADEDADPAAPARGDRRADGGAIWLEVEREGYARRFGLVHRRRFYLAADGADLRGEDTLRAAPGAAPAEPRPYAVRFHLHPDVAAAQAPDGRSALLRLADGAQWRLSAPSGLAIVGSVYFADGFARRDGEQAVVAGVCGAEGATVKWALRRVRQADRPADSPFQA